jgi:hypothetical protein
MARLTITEAAARLDVSPDSIRRRLRKGELAGTRDNRGQWWLDLPDDMQPEVPAPSVEARLASAMLAPAQHQPMQPDPALVDALRGQVADLTDRLNRAEVREAERQVADDRRGQELTAALLRTAIAETETRALREALEEARRPAWRRWLGLP